MDPRTPTHRPGDTGVAPTGGVARAMAAALGLVAAVLAMVVLVAAPAGAQDDAGPGTTEPAGSTAVLETTTTLPSGGEIGNILPRPNSGREPQTPGDPGGSQQVMLFFAICAAILGITGFVYWRSRVARARRAAAGRDPVTVARQSGGDVRKPRPPGIVD
ncbi:MAG: hypothetical protein R2716_06850 [Microthrixaceae bacterium]